MGYRFSAKATALDFFKMSMKKTYSSPLGICNIVFFAAVVLLTLKMFGDAGPFLRAVLLILCILIPVIQPLSVHVRSAALARMIPEGLTIETQSSGLLVTAGEKSETITYDRISRIVADKDCVVLYVGARSGYFLFNRVMGGQKEAFVDHIKSHMGKR